MLKQFALAIFLLTLCIYKQPTTFAQDELGSLVVMAWSPDDSQIAVGYQYGIELIDSSTQEVNLDVRLVGDRSNDISTIRNLAWSPSGSQIAVAKTHQIAILNAQTGEIVNTIGDLCPDRHPEQGFLGAAAWSHDETQIVMTRSCGMGATETNGLQIWDLSSGEKVQEFSIGRYGTTAHQTAPTSVWWLSDDQIISSSVDNIVIWDTDLNPVRQLNNSEHWGINASAISADGAYIAAMMSGITATNASESGVRIWDTTTGELLQRIENPFAFDMAWNADNTKIALFGSEISVLDIQIHEIVSTFPLPQLPTATVVSNDRSRIAYSYSERHEGMWTDTIEIIEFPSNNE